MIKQYCDEMVIQEGTTPEYHTLIAVDPDVIHMGAFPLENLAQGSVFHAWAPLRRCSMEMSQVMRDNVPERRTELLSEIFEGSDTRISLLTTIALSTYIFRQRGPLEAFGGYTVLPPHQQEWDNAVVKARHQADDWKHSLSKVVDVAKVRKIVENARREQNPDVEDALVKALPLTVSALFPAQLSPDHGIASCIGWQLSGALKPYDKIAGLPSFDSILKTPAAQKLATELAERISSDITNSQAFQELDAATRQRQLQSLQRTIDGDAKVLAFLHSIRDDPPTVAIAGKALPLRVILLTASARIWRVARAKDVGLALRLRSPLSYLSDGNFFEWAFAAAPASTDADQASLLERLRDGLLSVWLGPLTTEGPPATSRELEVARSECLRQWETLMSHLATSLNLASPKGALQKALAAVLSEDDRANAAGISALLQLKIIDATNRLALNANQVGLTHVRFSAAQQRNLPPMRMLDHAQAGPLLRRLYKLSAEKERLPLLMKIMSLEADALDKVASSYFQSTLVSLLWFHLAHWDEARDVAKQAAAYALLRSPDDDRRVVADFDIDGEEALYLLAVTARHSASETRALELARLALKAASNLPRVSPIDLRFQAEGQLLRFADLLMGEEAQDLSGFAGLRTRQLSDALKHALALINTSEWRRIRDQVDLGPSAGQEDEFERYMELYSLQQMYCAVGLLFLLAFVRGDAGDTREDMQTLNKEFGKLCMLHRDGGVLQLVDSDTFEAVRFFVSYCLVDERNRTSQSAQDMARRCADYKAMVSSDRHSPLERRVMAWLAGAFAKR